MLNDLDALIASAAAKAKNCSPQAPSPRDFASPVVLGNKISPKSMGCKSTDKMSVNSNTHSRRTRADERVGPRSSSPSSVGAFNIVPSRSHPIPRALNMDLEASPNVILNQSARFKPDSSLVKAKALNDAQKSVVASRFVELVEALVQKHEDGGFSRVLGSSFDNAGIGGQVHPDIVSPSAAGSAISVIDLKRLCRELVTLRELSQNSLSDSSVVEPVIALLPILVDHVKGGLLQDDDFNAESSAGALHKIECPLEAAVVAFVLMSTPDIDRRLLADELVDVCLLLLKKMQQQHLFPAIDSSYRARVGRPDVCRPFAPGEDEQPSDREVISCKYKNEDVLGATMQELDDENNGDWSEDESDATRPSRGKVRAVVGKRTTKRKDRSSSSKCMGGRVKTCVPNNVARLGARICELVEWAHVLLTTVKLSDAVVLQLSTLSIASLVVDAGTSLENQCTLLSLQHASISLLQDCFSSYAIHRGVIIEDIIAILLQLPFGKNSRRTYSLNSKSSGVSSSFDNGSSADAVAGLAKGLPVNIQMSSALIMLLVHSCVTEHPFIGGATSGEVRGGMLQECASTARLFCQAILDRCARKDGNEFRLIFSELLRDWIEALHLPEWPAAETLLQVLGQILSADLFKRASGAGGNSEMESSYSLMALDSLGKICSSLRGHIRVEREQPFINIFTDSSICLCGKAVVKDVSADLRCNDVTILCNFCNRVCHQRCAEIFQRNPSDSNGMCHACVLRDQVDRESQRYQENSAILASVKMSSPNDLCGSGTKAPKPFSATKKSVKKKANLDSETVSGRSKVSKSMQRINGVCIDELVGEAFLGLEVERQFGKKWFRGKVVAYYKANASDEKQCDLWRIVYSDKDTEDLNLDELRRAILKAHSRAPAIPRSFSKSPAPKEVFFNGMVLQPDLEANAKLTAQVSVCDLQAQKIGLTSIRSSVSRVSGINMLRQTLLNSLTKRCRAEPSLLFVRRYHISMWLDDDRRTMKSSDYSTSASTISLLFLHQWDTGLGPRPLPSNFFVTGSIDMGLGGTVECLSTHSESILDQDFMHRTARQLAATRPLMKGHGWLMDQLMRLLSEGQPSFRSRVLRSLSLVADADPLVLAESRVQAAIASRFLDEAISVRQASVDLVGRCMTLQPELADQYTDMVLERLLDTGVSVRKSVVKILRDALLLHQRHTALTGVAAGFEASSREGFLGEGRDVLICRKLVELCGKVYEEDSVKNLIYSTFEDLWFSSPGLDGVSDLSFRPIRFAQQPSLFSPGSSLGPGEVLHLRGKVVHPSTSGVTVFSESKDATSAQPLEKSQSPPHLYLQRSAGVGSRPPPEYFRLAQIVRQIMGVIDADFSTISVVPSPGPLTGNYGTDWLAEVMRRFMVGPGEGDRDKKTLIKQRQQNLDQCERLVGCLVEYLLQMDEEDIPIALSSCQPSSSTCHPALSPAKSGGSSLIIEASWLQTASPRPVCSEKADPCTSPQHVLLQHRSPAKRMVAALAALDVFACASPKLLGRHLDTLLRYLRQGDKNSFNSQFPPADEIIFLSHLLSIASVTLPILSTLPPATVITSIASVEVEVVLLIKTKPPGVVLQAVRCLKVIQDIRGSSASLIHLLRLFYEFLNKNQIIATSGGRASRQTLFNIHRSLYALGLLIRYNNFDKHLEAAAHPETQSRRTSVDDSSCLLLEGYVVLDAPIPQKKGKRKFLKAIESQNESCANSESRAIREGGEECKNLLGCDGPVADAVYSICCKFARSGDLSLRCSALQSFGYLFLGAAHLLLRAESDGLLGELLKDSEIQVQTAAVSCLCTVLREEERRLEGGFAAKTLAVRASEQEQVRGDRDSDASGIASVIQLHLSQLLRLVLSPAPSLRSQTVTLLCLTIRQGLCNPIEAIPTLIALLSDPVASVRFSASRQLILLHERHPEFLRTSLLPAFRLASAHMMYGPLIENQNSGASARASALPNAHHACQWQCSGQGNLETFILMFGKIYASFYNHRSTCIRENRSVRYSVLALLLNLFEDNSVTKNCGSAVSGRLYFGSNDCIASDTSVAGGGDGNEEPRVPYLRLLCFITQLLAQLPYGTSDEPLFIIHSITRFISYKGCGLQDAALHFFPGNRLEASLVEDEFDRVPESAFLLSDSDIVDLRGRCDAVFAASLLLRLKHYLKNIYLLTDSKCQSYVPDSAKSSEKYLHRPADPLPALLLTPPPQPMSSAGDLWVHCVTFWRLMRDDPADMAWGLSSRIKTSGRVYQSSPPRTISSASLRRRSLNQGTGSVKSATVKNSSPTAKIKKACRKIKRRKFSTIRGVSEEEVNEDSTDSDYHD